MLFIQEMNYLLYQHAQQIKDGIYIINFEKYKSIGANWGALYVNGDVVTYFDSFRVEYIPKKFKTI